MASNDRNESFESVDAQSVNNVRYADPGEVQSVIDDAASDPDVGIGYDKARARVALKAGTVYDEGAEITVKPGVDLDLNGANLGNTQNGGDHNILFMDTGSGLVGDGKIGVASSGYTSDAVLLDADRATHGTYALGQAGNPAGTQVQMRAGHLTIRGDGTNGPNGTGLAFRGGQNPAQGGGAVTIGSNFDMTIFWMENGVYADQDGTFTNFDNSQFTIQACVNHIRQGPNSNQFKTPIQVTHQPNVPTERMYYNEGSGSMPITRGAHWDPGNCAVNALVGSNIHLRQEIMTNADWTANSDGDPAQLVYQPGGFPSQGYNRFEHPGTGGEWGIDPRGGNYEVVDEANNYNAMSLISDSGVIEFGSRVTVGGGTGSSFPNFTLPSGGGIYEAGDGDPEVVDDAGNTSTIGSL
jgi:hypothetical protein